MRAVSGNKMTHSRLNPYLLSIYKMVTRCPKISLMSALLSFAIIFPLRLSSVRDDICDNAITILSIPVLPILFEIRQRVDRCEQFPITSAIIELPSSSITEIPYLATDPLVLIGFF